MPKSNNSNIIKFLNEGKNSMLRETIFKYAFYHDIKLAAAQFNSNLKIYEPEVDNEGCDIIIEDTRDFSRKIQLKSTYHSRTAVWHIHKNILCPAFNQSSDFGLDNIFCPTYPGAVVLIKAKEKTTDSANDFTSHKGFYPQNDYEYLYTDINVIYLIYLDIIKGNSSAKANAKRVISLIREPFYFDKIKVQKNLFITVNGTASLIKLLGFCGQVEFLNHTHKFIRNCVNPANFFKTLLDYNPYEVSEIELQNRNQLLNKDKELHKELVIKSLKQLVLI
ncbi:MAG: hypothetical protein MUC81_05715 [Bacteroidia bacterium]|jgi:hypothetical protein|nr:hypothetical protein [Bacteroidia bacterium]